MYKLKSRKGIEKIINTLEDKITETTQLKNEKKMYRASGPLDYESLPEVLSDSVRIEDTR